MERPFVGLMFVRKLEGKAILCAVIDCPDASKIQGEALHVFAGLETKSGTIALMTTKEIKDIKELAHGNSIDGILCSPIWKTGSPKELPEDLKAKLFTLFM